MSEFLSGTNPSLLYRVNSLQALAAPVVAVGLGSGAGTWGYKVVVKDSYGNILGVSAQGTVANATTLSAGVATNTITCPASYPTFDGNTPTCYVYRTATGGTPANLSLVASAQAMGTVVTDDGSVVTATADPTVIVGTAANANFYKWTVPANTIRAGRGIKITATFHRTGSANCLLDASWGGSATTSHVFSSTTVTDCQVISRICNDDNTTASQSFDCTALLTNAVISQAYSKATTSAQDFIYTFNVAATDTLAPKTFTVELLP